MTIAKVVRIQGARELDNALRQLAEASQRRVVRNAMVSLARMVQREVRNAAPRGKDDPHPKYGRLRQNIRVRPIPSQRRFTVVIHTGRAFWARWVEYGRGEVTPRKKKVLSDRKTIFGRKVRPQAARPFFRPAWDAIAPRLLPELAQRISYYLQRELARGSTKRR